MPNRRLPQNIGGARVLTAHRDFSDLCEACGGYIERGQYYVKTGRDLLHYNCQKKGKVADRDFKTRP